MSIPLKLTAKALDATPAGPGVLFGASLTAVLVKFTFPYDWSWVECLLFGAVFSATDPVAVVAVLKEVRNYGPIVG